MDIFAPSTWTNDQRAIGAGLVTLAAQFVVTFLQQSGNANQIPGMKYNPTLGRYVASSQEDFLDITNDHNR